MCKAPDSALVHLSAGPFGLRGRKRADEGFALKKGPVSACGGAAGFQGSGKTIVAALAALQVIENGYQAAIMAPTEILAEQHYLKLRDWLMPLGITPVWLSGSLKKKEKQLAAEKIANGETLLAIGTHALFQQSVDFHKLGLAIVDEQHKFGVQQRLALRNKGKFSKSVRPELVEGQDASGDVVRQALHERPINSIEPHLLMMSATPIPRTLAMSYYADLDVSVIDELPPGRTPIATRVVADTRRDEVIERIRDACMTAAGGPGVPVDRRIRDLAVANRARNSRRLLGELFPELQGRPRARKLDYGRKDARVMAAFKSGEFNCWSRRPSSKSAWSAEHRLMVIDHAERMGLAQLHQLRGRVGRGAAESLCVLLYQQPLSELARARLKIIYESNDGFAIAQHDLQLRGPGELLGARQSGVAMLRFADISADEDLLDHARQVSDELLRDFPEAARAHLHRWMADKQDYLHG